MTFPVPSAKTLNEMKRTKGKPAKNILGGGSPDRKTKERSETAEQAVRNGNATS